MRDAAGKLNGAPMTTEHARELEPLRELCIHCRRNFANAGAIWCRSCFDAIDHGECRKYPCIHERTRPEQPPALDSALTARAAQPLRSVSVPMCYCGHSFAQHISASPFKCAIDECPCGTFEEMASRENDAAQPQAGLLISDPEGMKRQLGIAQSRESAREVADTILCDCDFREHEVHQASCRSVHQGAHVAALIESFGQSRHDEWEREHRMCSVCAGQPLTSGRTCICGGVGTEIAEADGLRKEVYRLDNELKSARGEGVKEGKQLVAELMGPHVMSDDQLDKHMKQARAEGQRAGINALANLIRAHFPEFNENRIHVMFDRFAERESDAKAEGTASAYGDAAQFVHENLMYEEGSDFDLPKRLLERTPADATRWQQEDRKGARSAGLREAAELAREMWMANSATLPSEFSEAIRKLASENSPRATPGKGGR